MQTNNTLYTLFLLFFMIAAGLFMAMTILMTPPLFVAIPLALGTAASIMGCSLVIVMMLSDE